LDVFVLSLLEKDKNLRSNFKEEWILLKSFDRGFWLKSHASKNNLNYKSLFLENKVACPFEDPVGTGSFMEMPMFE
jgi:hypothetical protein